MKRSEQIKQDLRRNTKMLTGGKYVSTGSTLLNLACTGHPDRGFETGHYYLFVGDSDSGKTFLSLTCFAEAAANSEFDDYRLIYDGTEHGAMMNISRFFGQAVSDRMEAPGRWDDGTPKFSETVQDFYFNLDDALKQGRPFIEVLDSQDCLSSAEEITKFQEQKTASRKGKAKEVSGSYGDGKARFHSANLRKIITPLARTGSILIIINQTRDSFDPFESSTYSGGRALKFYATLQLWSSSAGKIKRTIKGKVRELGTYCKVRVKKNRVVGKDRTVVIPVYHSYGVDDLGGCVDYLISEGFWKKGDGESKITVRGLGPEFVMGREALIRKIEEDELESDLRELTTEVWNDVEKACEVSRRRRYE